MVPHLMRAALAVGIDGLFLEVHPDPDNAISDAANQVRLSDIENILNQFGRCTITFSCKPQKFLLSGTDWHGFVGGGTITNPTPFDARPFIRVSGVGEIVINGKSIIIQDTVSNFLIDCESMEATDNSKIYCMDFPVLSGGENTVTCASTITSLSMVPRWWTL